MFELAHLSLLHVCSRVHLLHTDFSDFPGLEPVIETGHHENQVSHSTPSGH